MQDGSIHATREDGQLEQIFLKNGSQDESFQEDPKSIKYKKDDIRFHVVRDRMGQAELTASREFSSHQEETSKNKRGEKMRQMRQKMTLTRQKAEMHKERNMIVMKIRKPKHTKDRQ